MSCRILSPRLGSSRGLWIHPSMKGGIHAGSTSMSQPSGSLARNAWNLPFDSSSARMAPSWLHRVIFSMLTLHPIAAATLPMADTSVVQSRHLVLYPFLQMPTHPALSTQMRTGQRRQCCRPALTHMRGPTNSRADNFRLMRLPSAAFTLLFIRGLHGT